MNTTGKVPPVVGMKVTWIDPKDDPKNRQFIQIYLIDVYGTDGLTIRSVRNREQSPLVSLNKNGKPIFEKFPKGIIGRKGIRIEQVDWCYLRPI